MIVSFTNLQRKSLANLLMSGDSSKDIICAAVQYYPLYPPRLDPERIPVHIDSRRLNALTNYLDATDKDLAVALKQHLRRAPSHT